MKYLKVVNWDTWQTFRKDRATPPWIKLYRNLFSNPEWAQLSDGEKGQLISMWILAADKGGKIASDPRFIRKMCGLDKPPNLQRFKDLGFLVDCLTTTRQPQTENVTKQRRGEERRVEDKDIKVGNTPADPHRDNFESVWSEYPKKFGKHEAWLKFRKQVETDQDLIDIKKALEHYKRDVEYTRNTTNPKLEWQHGSTWFNNRWRDYIDLDPPKKEPRKPRLAL